MTETTIQLIFDLSQNKGITVTLISIATAMTVIGFTRWILRKERKNHSMEVIRITRSTIENNFINDIHSGLTDDLVGLTELIGSPFAEEFYNSCEYLNEDPVWWPSSIKNVNKIRREGLDLV